jgi:hypothetical protein
MVMMLREERSGVCLRLHAAVAGYALEGPGRLRTAAGLSQEELGQRISYRGSLVGMVETARAARHPAISRNAATMSWPPAGRWPGYGRWSARKHYHAGSGRSPKSSGQQPASGPGSHWSSRGLLQTEDYARELITAWQPGDTREAVEQQITARMERQQILDREDPPLLWMIISEIALRNPVGGPDVPRDQLTRLLDR